MAFDINKSKRLPADGIEEVDSDSTETTLNLVEQASGSNVIATQSWVSKLLRGFCSWTKVFHTNVVHAFVEMISPKITAGKANID